MKKNYVEYCTISTFGIDREAFNSATSEILTEGLVLQFMEKDLCGKIVVAKANVDNIAIESVINHLNSVLGEAIYADKDVSISQRLVEVLRSCGSKVSVAESITGGLICSEICGVEGASEVFYEGLVTYNSGAKVRRLHVPAQIIEQNSAVAKATTEGMLKGVLSNKEINYAIATTGYASNADKDSGLAFVGYGDINNCIVDKVKFDGERNEIRAKVANYAMFKLLKFIENNNLSY